ncbi:MAG: hypothetical protein U9Q68_04900 [Euryarchaeota archaeon]|nr:hypothetical protein [Euryarchaeota archaeon]
MGRTDYVFINTPQKRRMIPTIITQLQNHIENTVRAKKGIIAYLGKLTPEKAQQIRNVLKISASADTIVTTIDDLLFVDHWHYLDVAFLNHLWDKEWRYPLQIGE